MRWKVEEMIALQIRGKSLSVVSEFVTTFMLDLPTINTFEIPMHKSAKFKIGLSAAPMPTKVGSLAKDSLNN